MTLASSIGSVINGVSNTEVSWLSRGKVPALNSKSEYRRRDRGKVVTWTTSCVLDSGSDETRVILSAG
jgi:hypothetical protein